MTELSVAWGVLLVVVGVAVAARGFHGIFHRPGWSGRYGTGSWWATIGGFLVLAGVVTLLIA